MKKKSNISQSTPEPSSFRDPSGFVFYHKQQVFRQINQVYGSDFETFLASGLAEKLQAENLLIPFQKVTKPKFPASDGYAVLKTDKLPFISYPYEWSFGQLKDAALLTLQIQRMALDLDMTLKDASGFNVQFVQGKPIFIDLLSFTKYQPGQPWIAYRQFCQHFLAPLLLMSKVDLSLHKLLRLHLDGVPLDLTSQILPKSTYLSPAILSHIHIHARNQRKFAADTNSVSQTASPQLPKNLLMGIIDSLSNLVNSLGLPSQQTEWGEYYTFTNYSQSAFSYKKKLVTQMIKQTKPKTVWDLGGNTGEFSRLASNQGIFTLSFDIDPLAVEKNYLQVKSNQDIHILPLVMDFTNPSPNLGWQLSERQSLVARGPADMVMALALIHHLAISHNIPFSLLAEFFQSLGNYLLIEFVPKTDSKVQQLLATRQDIFSQYDQKNFESQFSQYFQIVETRPIGRGSQRILYLMKAKRRN